MSRALIVVDVQNDFCPGGSLAVDGGDRVAAGVTEFLATDAERYDLIVATMDWHPTKDSEPEGFDHFSDTPDFVDTWPPHCVQGTGGAAFHDNLVLPKDVIVVRKGQATAAYSGFEGNDEHGSSLNAILHDAGTEAVDIVGLATDYCVRATALDAIALGFAVNVHMDLVAGVAPETTQTATDELQQAGVALIT